MAPPTTDKQYQLVYYGEALEGFDPPTVRLALRRALGLDDARARRLFSGQPVVLHDAASAEAAWHYTDKFALLGARLRVEPAGARLRTVAVQRPAEAELPHLPVVHDTLHPPLPVPRRTGVVVRGRQEAVAPEPSVLPSVAPPAAVSLPPSVSVAAPSPEPMEPEPSLPAAMEPLPTTAPDSGARAWRVPQPRRTGGSWARLVAPAFALCGVGMVVAGAGVALHPLLRKAPAEPTAEVAAEGARAAPPAMLAVGAALPSQRPSQP